MNAIKKGVLLFAEAMLMLFAVIPVISVGVSARSFDARFEAIDNTIKFGQLAKFRLEVRNDLNTIEMFRVKTLEYPLWEIKTEPVMNPIQFSVMPDETKEMELFVNPLHVSDNGIYDVDVIVELVSKKEKLETPLRVNIISPQDGTYVETVLATIIMDDRINPEKDIPIKIMLNNQNIIEYPEIVVQLESGLIKGEVRESLGKKEKKTISLTKSIPRQTPPQEDTIVVRLIANNKTLDTKIKRIEVIKLEKVAREEKIREGLLKSIEDITLRNTGNTRYSEEFKTESSLVQMIFTSSIPKGKFIKEGGKRYLAVPVDIPPGGTLSIRITKNYRALLVIVVLMLIISAMYYIFRSPLVIEKKAANVSLKEGGVSELKVVVNVGNRSKIRLRDIEITDRLPNIVGIEKGLTIGTLQPIKVLNHEKKGTMIRWFIDGLDGGDERVISYKIKSHLSILGAFNLSPTTARFKLKGKERATRSNSLVVSPENPV